MGIFLTLEFQPLLVNRHLQSIIQHADFYQYTETNLACRDSIIHLVYTLFLKHPTNTCQPSHVLPLSPVYGGTLSIADRRLLNIFSLFEETRSISAASLLARDVSGLDNPLDVLLNIDPASVFRACLLFPSWRKLDDLGHHLDLTHPLDDRICDPVFVALLVAHVLATRPPSSTAQWVQLFRTNVMSLLIRSLSSRNGMLRDTCVAQISAIVDALQVRQCALHSSQPIGPDRPWIECGYAGEAPCPLYFAPAEGCLQGTHRWRAIPAATFILYVTPRSRPAWRFLSRPLHLSSHCSLPSPTAGARHNRRSDVVFNVVQQFR